jgi:TolB-like protein/Tfp pilus assembly protein PilF/predicted Ser/Thr protein kinase
MIKVIRVCRKCGTKIFSDAPKGLCTACALETALGIVADPVAAGELSAVASAKADDGGSAENVQTNNAHASPDSKTTTRIAKVLGELGDYELLEEIGRGGQGVVFRARQKSLNRTVALKIIGLGQWASKAHVKRFRLEAEAAARLDHPSIVPIYEVGERDGSCFFSMKFVEGGQLDEAIRRTPMPIRQAAELMAKVARTVHYAHEHGILHRDIKPGNILLDAKGEPHLTDFGLARLVESESTVTRTLEVMGTPSYMAPEQAAGNNAGLSSATDVYGLGAVFYQLLTGHPPFAGGTTFETVRLVLDTEPRQPRLWNPKVDRDLSTICLKCLEKDPQRRYSSALALAEDLERWLRHEPIRARHTGIFTRGKKWVRRNPTPALLFALSLAFAGTVGVMIWKSRPEPPPATGVAVLPFVNMSAEKENEYLGDGLTEDLCTALSQIKGLRVPARTSSFMFKGKTEDIRKIGKQLNVSTVLEGSVSRAGNKVRISAQLNNVADGYHLWAETYDRYMTDILEIRSDISRKVADALKVQLGVKETHLLAKKPSENSEAYEIYLLGRFEFNKFTEDGFTRSLAHFQQAIALDPKFALAYASLADAYNTMGYWGYLPPKEAFPEAKRAAQMALNIDPDLAEAHGALGYVEFQYEWKFKEAEMEFREAIRLNPNSVSALLQFFEYLFDFQRTQEAQEQLERARELDPLSIQIAFYDAAVSFYERDFDRAIEQLQKTISMDPNNAWAYHLLGAIFYQKKMPAQAFTAHEKANSLEGIFSDAEMADMRNAYETAGLSAYFRKENELRQKRLAEGRYQSPLKIALNYAFAGDDSEVLDWLERAVEEHTPWLPELKHDPTWDAVRSQPRFVALLKKIGLEK